jgi:indolepyruvate ferredoxin oxidoreductase beta subunit
MQNHTTRSRISIAVLALGGQGGGVLTHWIAQLAGRNGYRAQATSVPGVAQRTGATVYYVELIPWNPNDSDPVLALMPTPGDVDVVLASELMEAGRAMIRGFVSPDQTTLIASTHRVYAISEKSARGNGLANSETVLAAARSRAQRFIAFDMAAASEQARCAISAVMFGALAGSGALPFAQAAYIEAMHSDGKGTETNLAGFNAGLEGARYANRQLPLAVAAAHGSIAPPPSSATHASSSARTATAASPSSFGPRPPAELLAPTTVQGHALRARVISELPTCCHHLAIEGVRRLVDYQDYAYAATYLDRLAQLRELDNEYNGWELTREAARYLALFMAYDDTIRVADLKARDTRRRRIRAELGVRDDQLLRVTDFMHPRFRELCDTLPRPIGQRLLQNRLATRVLSRLFRKGRFIESTRIMGFGLLLCLASLRRWRRATLRYAVQEKLIVSWLQLAKNVATTDPEAALEIIRCQRLIKGYGETYENGLAAFHRIIAAYRVIEREPHAASRIRSLREAALGST